MLPTVVAGELRDAVSQFLRSAFPIATPYFQNTGTSEGDPQALFDDLLARPGALFKGPYLDIKLPFRLADEADVPFRRLTLPFRPYRHQITAFRRLCGESPQSTIVATGTGSGKTECFMLPVLDDCLTRRERGIKTIVIYPMNALAADQARRFAAEVRKLDSQLTVGLFVGGEQKDATTSMGPDYVITSQATLRENPPDILLTNYKMLDFLLIRPKDQPLWRYNNPGTLRYLVVDELHTFDGAQGTDLACLIRRLRDRLESGPELACVGTSATMGTESLTELVGYASQVFATDLDEHAVVGEDRLSPDEYLLGFEEEEREAARQKIRFFGWPDRREHRLDPAQYERAEDYLFHQARLWFENLPMGEVPALNAPDERKRADAAVRLGELLHQHNAFHELVRATEHLTDMSLLATDWHQKLNLPSREQSERLLTSLTSLVATARQWRDTDSEDPSKWCQPFLEVRQQLWLRELRRLVCSVPAGPEERPAIHFADDLKDSLKPLHLPLVHCRECHMAAWGAVAKKGDNHLVGDLQDFYQSWFQYSAQSRLLVPLLDEPSNGETAREFCPQCLRLQANGTAGQCQECGNRSLQHVWVPDMARRVSRGGQERLESHHDCPECEARDSLAVVGYRAVTLTSVMTGRLFATPYNDDFKLIAFSDSVQDAAHRAGFLGANTWRQVVRQGMVGWLRQQPVPLTLREMRELLPTFWRDRINDDRRFCGLFIGPDMAWLSDHQNLAQTGRLRQGSDLPELVQKRLAWECTAEFGRRGSFGRSLERTGMAAVGLDAGRMEADIGQLANGLREEIEALRDIPDVTIRRFVIGWLHHMRQNGATYDPVLESYLSNKGREYLLNRLHWMPGFGRSRRPPAPVTLGHVSPNFEALVQAGRDTWAVHWLKKTLAADAVFAAAEARQIFHLSLHALTRTGWLIEKQAAGESLYLLNPDRLLISPRSRRLECTRCRHGVWVAPDAERLYNNLQCLRPRCTGTLKAGKAPPRTRDYGFAQPRRLVASEHTGLLSRELRERIEHSFIYGDEPWDINLLSATPTLEMGIDVGTLSSIFLCSVPPAQANYLQRIGRAGRRDGNALAVTVANGRNHDLFFYSEPLEMIAGAVRTPGVFLQANAVLERQLIAYCFDRWAATGIDDSAIPRKLRRALDAVEHQRQDQFPYTIIAFVGDNRDRLLSSFFALFAHLSDESKQYLEGFLSDSAEGTLSWRLVDRLQRLVKERKSLQKRVQQLKAERERLQRRPEDEATNELIDGVEQERSALLSLLGSINNQPVLNFFTDEGLLPNYAFPEEGVTLHSVILRRRSADQSSESRPGYEKASYSFQRPAQAALGELAPDNRFYAVSHEMQIDQVDLQLSETESWRFCDRCHHTERVDVEDRHSACPRCGSPQWADSGQKHTVLKLRQVFSTMLDRTSRIGDDAEQREPQFYNRQMLVDAPEGGNHGGFRLKSDVLPFGFEFLPRATFREVNFGTGGAEAKTFSVAGRELSRRGFRICRHCGKVRKERPRKNERLHAFTCKLYKRDHEGAPEDYLESLYLYRELNSEAIRILLPLSEVAYSEEKLHSFVAALNLGLRQYFHGDVHHLEVTDMREPPSPGSGERVYLVVYDRIPGGTGYLKELMRTPDNLMKVLEGAYQRLTTCSCIDNEHLDGCYRCIFAYRDSRHMAAISRKAAAEILGEILALREQLEPVASLGEISTNVLVESKLEQKFVDALGALAGARLSRTVINGKAGSLLTLPGADGRPVPWQVEHQVRVGPSEGVAVHTEIDVLLTPARADDAAQGRPIAVYLDGLQYHHEIVADDVTKRTALLLSGHYWVFSLNWDDLPEPGKLVRPVSHSPMRADGPFQREMRALYDELASKGFWKVSSSHEACNANGSLDWLEQLLRAPTQAAMALRERALYRAFTALAPNTAKDADARKKLVRELVGIAPEYVRNEIDFDSPNLIPGGFVESLGNALPGMSVAAGAEKEALQAVMQSVDAGSLEHSLWLHLCFDDTDSELTDEFKEYWRSFWHSVNQLQFMPGFSMATRTAVASGSLDQVWSTWQALSDATSMQGVTGPGGDDPWSEVFELSVLNSEQIRGLMELGLPAPEVGVDIATDSGEVVLGGEAVELCWVDSRVAIVTQSAHPEISGWRLISVDAALAGQMKELIEQGAFS